MVDSEPLVHFLKDVEGPPAFINSEGDLNIAKVFITIFDGHFEIKSNPFFIQMTKFVFDQVIGRTG